MLLFQLAQVNPASDKWNSMYKGKRFHKFTPNTMMPKPSSHYRDTGAGRPPPHPKTRCEDVGGGEIPENFENVDKEERPLLCPDCSSPYLPGKVNLFQQYIQLYILHIYFTMRIILYFRLP